MKKPLKSIAQQIEPLMSKIGMIYIECVMRWNDVDLMVKYVDLTMRFPIIKAKKIFVSLPDAETIKNEFDPTKLFK